MIKKLLILILPMLFLSCDNPKATPIDKYKNKGVVVIEEPTACDLGNNKWVRCKTKDSIFFIKITNFDAKNLKIGDTIK